MWVKALTIFDNKFSWGSVALAYLYQQLDEACIAPQETSGLVVLCSYFRYGAGNAFLLDALERQCSIPGMTTTTMYDFPPGLTSGTWYQR
ncbi:mutator protein [Hordeum vulgare]|nr:mutator protein [Hordeum vulgare]